MNETSLEFQRRGDVEQTTDIITVIYQKSNHKECSPEKFPSMFPQNSCSHNKIIIIMMIKIVVTIISKIPEKHP